MNPALVELIAACITLVGTHFAMSHPLRAPMVRIFGAIGFQGVYSLVSLAAMVWIYLSFTATGAATPPLWPGFGDISWAIGSLLTLAAMVLFAGSFIGNPALPAPGAEQAAKAPPHGVFLITRHPMMWGFALWAIAHMIAAPTPRTLVVAITVLILALVGAHLQDRKKLHLMGEAWAQWESRTSYWPRWRKFLSVGALPMLGGLGLWLVLSWSHLPLGGIAAGIWRWL